MNPQVKKMYDTAKKADRKDRREMLAALTQRSRARRMVRLLADACHTKEGTIMGYIYGYREPSELVQKTINDNLEELKKILEK
jgi:hypothetical protein